MWRSIWFRSADSSFILTMCHQFRQTNYWQRTAMTLSRHWERITVLPLCSPTLSCSFIRGLCRILKWVIRLRMSNAMSAISPAWRLPFLTGRPDTTNKQSPIVSTYEEEYIRIVFPPSENWKSARLYQIGSVMFFFHVTYEQLARQRQFSFIFRRKKTNP